MQLFLKFLKILNGLLFNLSRLFLKLLSLLAIVFPLLVYSQSEAINHNSPNGALFSEMPKETMHFSPTENCNCAKTERSNFLGLRHTIDTYILKQS